MKQRIDKVIEIIIKVLLIIVVIWLFLNIILEGDEFKYNYMKLITPVLVVASLSFIYRIIRKISIKFSKEKH